MIKIAQDNDPKDLMMLYVAFLKALYNIHQEAHWSTKGKNFYGNHLLFQRLYENVQENLDEAAEKTIGLFEDLPPHQDLVKDICDRFNVKKFNGDYIQASLKAEQAFLALSATLYKQIKNLKAMTLGLDDFIMGMANKHEVHIYLLKQALES